MATVWRRWLLMACRHTCSAVTPPSSPVPVPKGITGTCFWAHRRTMALTSATLVGQTTAGAQPVAGEAHPSKRKPFTPALTNIRPAIAVEGLIVVEIGRAHV